MSPQMLRLSVIAGVAVLCAHAYYEVPVYTQLTAERTRVPPGAEINLLCAVGGYPEPVVHWTKNGVALASDDRIALTDARHAQRANAKVLRANLDDSGVYGCHATNAYSSNLSTVNIIVEALYIPPKCTDNPHFANCPLIVRSKFCNHKYYSRFCCKSCVKSGQIDPHAVELQN